MPSLHHISMAALRKSVRTLVFGGGASFSIMYIGALQEVVEHDPVVWRAWVAGVSSVVGASAGALVAFMVAMGIPPWTMQDLVDTMWPLLESLVSIDALTLSPGDVIAQGSLCPATSINHVCRAFVARCVTQAGIDNPDPANVSLGDLARLSPMLHICVTNTTTNTPEIWSPVTHPHVPVWLALRASCSVPGIFPSVAGCYADAGLTCNLPIHVFPMASTMVFMVVLPQATTRDSKPLMFVRSYMQSFQLAGMRCSRSLFRVVFCVTDALSSAQSFSFSCTRDTRSRLIECGARAARSMAGRHAMLTLGLFLLVQFSQVRHASANLHRNAHRKHQHDDTKQPHRNGIKGYV